MDIEDLEPEITEQSDVPAKKVPMTTATSSPSLTGLLLGKRTHQQKTTDSNDQQQKWNDESFLASINEDHSIDTSHPTLANAPKTKTKLEDDSESLLGIMLKRQRLNSESMGKKQDFSFMPSLTAMTRKDAPLNTSSDHKRRDLKAADKKFNCQQPRTPTTEPSIPDVIHRRNRISNDKKYQLPKVDIKVPDLLDDNRKLSSMKF